MIAVISQKTHIIRARLPRAAAGHHRVYENICSVPDQSALGSSRAPIAGVRPLWIIYQKPGCTPNSDVTSTKELAINIELWECWPAGVFL